jgi:hypothetical protein
MTTLENNSPNEITPAAEAINTAARDVRQINESILREVESTRRMLDHVEHRIRGAYHLDHSTGIPDLDLLIAHRQDHVETLKLLQFALGRDA